MLYIIFFDEIVMSSLPMVFISSAPGEFPFKELDIYVYKRCFLIIVEEQLTRKPLFYRANVERLRQQYKEYYHNNKEREGSKKEIQGCT